MKRGKAYTPVGDQPGWWRDVPGYGGKYQASREGEIRYVYASGMVRKISGYFRMGDPKRHLYVKLSRDGVIKEKPILRVMAETWLPPPKPGQVAHHSNGRLLDNRIDNIAWIDRAELGRKTALLANKRKPVIKIDRAGEIVAIYPSARAAGRENAISNQAILDRCKNRVKKPFALDGHNYQFDD